MLCAYVVNSDTHSLLLLLIFQVDTKGTGVISALDAATFLKKSGLSVGVLSQASDGKAQENIHIVHTDHSFGSL